MTDFYGSVAEADEYHEQRGNAAWNEGSETDKQAALFRASEYIDGQYRSMFTGYRTQGREQLREWPREWAYVWDKWDWVNLPKDEIPREIKHATYEAALRELGTPGFLTPDVIPGNTRKSVRVEGAVAVEYWSDKQKPVIEKIGMVLAPLLDRNKLVRNRLSGKVTLA